MENSENRASEEMGFYELCFDVLERKMSEYNVHLDVLRNAIGELIESFRYSTGRRFAHFNLNEPRNVCAYLNRLGPMHTALVRYRLIQAFLGCGELQDIFQRESLHILDVGSGPGTDGIGFCSALEHFDVWKAKVHFTFVDQVPLWSSFIDDMWSRFAERNPSFPMDRIRRDFLNETISSDPSPYFKEILNSADIILMPRFLSIIETTPPVLQMLHDNIKEDALLIIIDTIRIKEGTVEELVRNAGFSPLYVPEYEDPEDCEEFHLTYPAADSPLARYGVFLENTVHNTKAQVFIFTKKKIQESQTSITSTACSVSKNSLVS